jgi:hypothetical protein
MTGYLSLIETISILGCIWILYFRIKRLEDKLSQKEGDKRE